MPTTAPRTIAPKYMIGQIVETNDEQPEFGQIMSISGSVYYIGQEEPKVSIEYRLGSGGSFWNEKEDAIKRVLAETHQDSAKL